MGSGGVNNGCEEKVKNVQRGEKERLRIGRDTGYCICHLVFVQIREIMERPR